MPTLTPQELQIASLKRQRAMLEEIEQLARNYGHKRGSWVELERETGMTSANIQRAKLDVLQKLNGEKACGKGNGAFRFGSSPVRSERAA